MNEALERKVANLPADPGVYLFKDAGGKLLYVGKARSLRARVKSYFQRGRDGRLATFFIERKVADLDFLVTRSVKEALLLENNLIKKMKPQYNLRLRDDKDPDDCWLPGEEKPLPERPLPRPKAAAAAVTITNPEKVFWPEEALTKADLVAYYRAVAKWLLPYIADGPLVLTRYPDGIDGKSF